MKKIYLIVFVLTICNIAKASPQKPLNVVIKDSNVCIFTNDKTSQPYNGRIYVYIGEVSQDKGYIEGYDKLYKNIKTPINKSDCISIDASHFKSNVPYDVSLDMIPSYSTRVCLDKVVKPFVIKKVVNGFECENKLLNKEEDRFFQRLFNLM